MALQFIVGLVVGAIVGVGVISRRRYHGGFMLDPEQAAKFFFGAALIGAGLASQYGDRLWFGLSYRVVPPDGIKHSDASRLVSRVTMLWGGALVIFALLEQFRIL